MCHKIFLATVISLKNDSWHRFYRVGVEQLYTYTPFSALRIRLLFPIFRCYITEKHAFSPAASTFRYWTANPTLTADFRCSPTLKMSANLYFRRTYDYQEQTYRGYVLHSFRHLQRNDIDFLPQTDAFGAQVSADYTDLLRMFFLNATCGIGYSRRNMLYGLHYVGITALRQAYHSPMCFRTEFFRMESSKTFPFIHLKIEASVGWRSTHSHMLLQDMIFPLRLNNGSFVLGCSMKPLSFVQAEYAFSYTGTLQKSKHNPSVFPYTAAWTHTAGAWLYPMKRIGVKFTVESRAAKGFSDTHAVFADALISYTVRNTDWELSCQNLFNATHLVAVSSSDMSVLASTVLLRPRNLMLRVRLHL